MGNVGLDAIPDQRRLGYTQVMSEGIQRRLAAILAADVAGYSRLLGEDESGTLAALRQLRTELFGPTVSDHRGKIIKSMGDGWLVEFASVIDAVNCAIELQERLAGNETIKLRIGVHLGDITHKDEDRGLRRDGVAMTEDQWYNFNEFWMSSGKCQTNQVQRLRRSSLGCSVAVRAAPRASSFRDC